jgi:hypothetical protein
MLLLLLLLLLLLVLVLLFIIILILLLFFLKKSFLVYIPSPFGIDGKASLNFEILQIKEFLIIFEQVLLQNDKPVQGFFYFYFLYFCIKYCIYFVNLK